jgi:hypothetical protein
MMRAIILVALAIAAGAAHAQAFVAPIRTTVSSPISATFSASRTSCTAPCAVLFDATATTATGVSRPFHHLRYSWNAGDGAAGAWTYGVRTAAGSKGVGDGPVWAYVFESAGTYTVTLTANDGTNSAQFTRDITVTAANTTWASNTLCISTAGVPTAGVDGCPDGATGLQSSDFDDAINSNLAKGCGGSGCRRFLFRAGQTFTSSGNGGALSVAGPGYVGAYGAGAKPIVSGASAGKIDVSANDWRVVGLDLRSATNVAVQPCASGCATGISEFLLQGNTFSSNNDATGLNSLFLSGGPVYSKFFWMENDFDGNTQYAIQADVREHAFMGNRVRNNTAQHMVRYNHCAVCVVSNNEIGPGSGGGLFMRAYEPFTAGGSVFPPSTAYTEKVVISENWSRGGHAFSTKYINTYGDSRHRIILVEANLIEATCFETSGGDQTIRNNLFLWSTLPSCAVGVTNGDADRQKVVPASVNDNVEVYNNTLYSSVTSSNDFVFTSNTGGTLANYVQKNNLVWMPNHSGSKSNISSTPAGASITNNSLASNPTFVGTPTASPLTDWRATSEAVVIDEGASVPVWSDFFRAARSGTYDLGAVNP